MQLEAQEIALVDAVCILSDKVEALTPEFPVEARLEGSVSTDMGIGIAIGILHIIEENKKT